MGNRLTRTTPSGLASAWTYDAADRPLTLSTAGNTLTFTHDATGHETQRAVGGVTLSQRWDETGRITAQTVTSAADDLIQHRTYAYRPDGYVTQIRELTSGTRHFTLDPVGRVTRVQAHGWTECYAYDAAGNQTHASVPGQEVSGERTFTGTLVRKAGRTVYEHDAAGRLICKTRKLLNGQTRTWAYAWSAEDRLMRVVTPDGETWTYSHDPLGRRIGQDRPEGREGSQPRSPARACRGYGLPCLHEHACAQASGETATSDAQRFAPLPHMTSGSHLSVSPVRLVMIGTSRRVNAEPDFPQS
ncbi:hypothetical protein ACFYQ5_12660 [Streptomyces sp. NPDC005794]|uniref:hypothetical protein n=1 Tax=Streptomyces sp. NPDC005794 TaxID=3364733 RepID=UPI0036B0A26C